jgi:hypothetical protein
MRKRNSQPIHKSYTSFVEKQKYIITNSLSIPQHFLLPSSPSLARTLKYTTTTIGKGKQFTNEKKKQ